MSTQNKIKLKKVCYNCYYFNKKLRPMQAYKCAVKSSCPGLNWSEERKRKVVERSYHG